MSDPLERLNSIFEKFPGIGPRQAARFVNYLLRSSSAMRRELAHAVQELGGLVHQCSQCMRYHSGEKKLCSICASSQRDTTSLAIVASDADLAALESSSVYRGMYFVLGGTISLASDKTNGLRIKPLLDSLPARTKKGLSEIILASPANPEGDATAVRLREELTAVQGSTSKITALGRGLSTGSELEYADPETIKSALEGRR